MIINSVVIAGAVATGTFAATLKVYRGWNRKRKAPWTAVASNIKKAVRGGTVRVPLPFLFEDDLRSQQLEAISSAANGRHASDAQKKEDRDLVVSLTSMLLATGGTLFYLNLLTIPPPII